MSEVRKLVSTEECLHINRSFEPITCCKDNHEDDCVLCGGTKLRWPTLSDKQDVMVYAAGKEPEMHWRRVAAVTLEKVFAAARAEGVNHIRILYEEDRIHVIFTPEPKSHHDDDLPFGLSDDVEKAACAALLATIGFDFR